MMRNTALKRCASDCSGNHFLMTCLVLLTSKKRLKEALLMV